MGQNKRLCLRNYKPHFLPREILRQGNTLKRHYKGSFRNEEMVKSVDGRELPLMKVISESLRFISEKAIEKLKEHYLEDGFDSYISQSEFEKDFDTFHFEPVDSRTETMKFSSSGFNGSLNTLFE